MLASLHPEDQDFESRKFRAWLRAGHWRRARPRVERPGALQLLSRGSSCGAAAIRGGRDSPVSPDCAATGR